MIQARTLPIRVAPVPGESLESWIGAIAARNRCYIRDVLAHLGLKDQAGRLPGRDLTIWVTPEESSAIASGAGVSPSVVEAMTLRRFDGIALSVDYQKRTLRPDFPWGNATGSRFCPDCLAENGGRWMLLWRLGWVFACVKHQQLLADACPDCGRGRRFSGIFAESVPIPGHCRLAAPGYRGRRAPPCRGDLTTVRTLRLHMTHPAIRAQELILDLVATGQASWGVYRGLSQPARVALADVRAIAGRTLSHASSRDLFEQLPPSLVAEYQRLEAQQCHRQAPIPASRPGLSAPSRAAAVAVGVTAAIQALGAPSVRSAGESLEWLMSTSRAQGLQCNATNSRAWGTGSGPVLEAVQLAALTPFMSATELLRYRVMRTMPARPNRNTAVVDPAKVPTLLWREWGLRFTLHARNSTLNLAALSATMLLIGTHVTLPEASRRLGAVANQGAITRMFTALKKTTHFSDVLEALTRLGAYLETHPVPINYDRRRSLVTWDELLPDERWSQICVATATNPGASRKADLVRALLFEHLTGSPAESAPFAARIPALRYESSGFSRDLTPGLAARLRDEARRFLDANGLHDEPISWHPPLALLDGLHLPGPDLSAVNIDELHRLLGSGERELTVPETARKLGTSSAVVRHLLWTNPAPEVLNTAQKHSRGVQFAQAQRLLPKSRFVELYVDQRHTLARIAADYGFGRKVVRRLASYYAVPVQSRRKIESLISEGWLRSHYLDRGLTMREVATICGNRHRAYFGAQENLESHSDPAGMPANRG